MEKLSEERLARIRQRHGSARCDVTILLAEIDRLRIIEREYHGHLLTQIQNMRHEGEGSDTVYFSDGNQVSVAILEKLEAAELLERVGSIGGGETGHIFGRLIPAGTQMMEGEPK